ncbi:TPR-like protein [Leucogyrophana mollusca]|uniref:TPR-like protein n=1 Tax=Leucogyrophana mollusca TaxID=85980 RepID=A0ACB8BYA9_9AGAM|nr:TPR-like protein [Leucogyrophana mollusca]
MSLSMLVGGADCGPSNPLQNLSKRFDQDRGIQQDYIGNSRAGSSREVFRTQQAPAQDVHQEAARFFAGTPAFTPQLSARPPFDFSAMHDALPQTPSQAPVQTPQRIAPSPLAGWASDFLQQQPKILGAPQVSPAHMEPQQERLQSPVSPLSGGIQGGMPWSPSYAPYRMSPMSNMMPEMHMQAQRPALRADQVSWDKEFQSQESMLSALSPAEVVTVTEGLHEQADQKAAVPTDEMARLAAQVINSVKDEQNPKFAQSQFMGLMRQLRDGEVVAEENAFVAKDAALTTPQQVDVKGKGRAVDPPIALSQQPVPHVATPTQFTHEAMAQNIESTPQHVDPNEAYFRQENADYARYWDSHYSPAAPLDASAQNTNSWHEMQQDWDSFEATTAGIKPVANYQFQSNNPYLLGDSSRTHHHTAHLSQIQRLYENVLELEATVQRDPSNASAWFELGVKQQENEREAKAIQALQRAVDLDPMHLSTWLALAVSYTNDSNRSETYNAIREWVMRNEKYASTVKLFMPDTTGPVGASSIDFSHLINCLMAMARSADQNGVDADVQVALAVLLNTTEDYAKAQDCFVTALAVRPEDWLLYNRVGATMANNGQAEEALQYYYRALDLNPAYIRARFNLGISCINLRRYDEAAHHVLDALVLQDSDGVADDSGMNDNRGVTSSTLWESLKTTCLHLQRIDLATLCDRRDLDGFRHAFHHGE